MERKTRNVEHKKLQAISSNYHYALKRLSEFEHVEHMTKSQIEIRQIYHHFIETVTKCIFRFNPLERSVLDHEYFAPISKLWWVNTYSRSTYYRIRLNIARRFIEYMELA